MRLALYAACLALGLCGPVLAQTVSPASDFSTLARQAGDRVAIDADALEISEETNTAIFSGNVVVRQGEMEMRAPRVTAVYGEGGPSDLKSFTAAGGRVRMQSDGQVITGDEAYYDFAARVLTFSGNVEVVNATGTVQSARLVIDTRAGTSSFSGGTSGGGRVTSVFTPGG